MKRLEKFMNDWILMSLWFISHMTKKWFYCKQIALKHA